jgi:tripeptide aminopeptidase
VTVAVAQRERTRLHETFAALCRIASPTGEERACADWITAELRAMGLEVSEDGAGAIVGATAGNLVTRIPGRSGRWLMLCAHMDTVPLLAPVDPVVVEDGWENANEAILGADNKAAIAVMLELARRFTTASEPPEVGLELVFTISEETGLHGARAFDASQLQSPFGYVLDQATPIGEIVVASPTCMRFEAEVRGKAAHAGLQPEVGVSAIIAAARGVAAMELGRLDAETTANVGTITGGTALNVIPERCRLAGEVRGIEPARTEQVLTAVIDAIQDAADEGACDLDVQIEKSFTGYRAKPAEPAVELAQRALRSIGYEPVLVASGVGTDANAFRVNGFSCLSLANGTEHPHEPTERVSFSALEAGLELVVALFDEAAAG